ncbi:MAG: hypothetical protein ACP5T4_02540 [Candidatus Micrarchaeia archaeon]
MSALGNGLIIIGLAILAGTFYLGYESYTGITSLQLITSLPANTNVTKSVSSMANAIVSNSNSALVVILKIIILFLFASIGYKFVALGINQNKASIEIQKELKEMSEESKNAQPKGLSKY